LASVRVARPGIRNVTGSRLLVRRLVPIVRVALTAIGVTVAAVAGSWEGRAQVEDPNDTRGPLDVRRVWFDPEAGPPQWSVVTFSPWSPEQTGGRAFAFVFLDTKKGAHPDYYVLILSTGHTLSGSLWRDVDRVGDIRLGSVAVSTGSGATGVTVDVPLGRLEFGALRTFYRWSVLTTFTGRVCRATCVDRVPDQGAVEQPLGTPTPTPTTSPTASPSAAGR
jgi:hypothetical protein